MSDLIGALEYLFSWKHFVDDPDVQCLCRGEMLSHEQQVAASVVAHQQREDDLDAVAWNETGWQVGPVVLVGVVGGGHHIREQRLFRVHRSVPVHRRDDPDFELEMAEYEPFAHIVDPLPEAVAMPNHADAAK
ncbi:hypothetical protein [Nocardia australiensis]|uniref:hypothetical protein n=1 Tax=Nocardia australiensis TaxID=2887191 RepID=UPI001D1520E6|nr:hypothetical protein [Nocardia australiensis]